MTNQNEMNKPEAKPEPVISADAIVILRKHVEDFQRACRLISDAMTTAEIQMRDFINIAEELNNAYSRTIANGAERPTTDERSGR